VPTATESPAQEAGVIVFGNGINQETLAVVTPSQVFPADQALISYSMALSEPAGATILTIVFAGVSNGGTESFIYKEDINISNPAFTMFANTVDLASIVGNAPGQYVMRALRGSDVLAEGLFTLQ
jgi:hypothetical protein